MPNLAPETLIELLEVRLEAFAMCEIGHNCALACSSLDSLLVHFVLEGEGAIECEYGRYELRRSRVLILPRNLAKRIEGPAPILSVVDVGGGFSLAPGFVRLRTSVGDAPGLVIGCASIAVDVGGAPGLFCNLKSPLLEECGDGPLPRLFEAMADELHSPGPGTMSLAEALMKQVLVVVLRNHLVRRSGGSPLDFGPRNPQLVRAASAITAKPSDPHSVGSLAALAGMSRSAFNRQFSASYGCSPMGFVQNVRLRTAARMLAGSELPVKSIAAAVGYASRSHFSRAFTAQFGDDPSRYRSSRESRGPVPSEGASIRLQEVDALV